MNRNPDGTPLTLDQLKVLAFRAGLNPSKVDSTTKPHVFRDASRALRHTMFASGDLVLDTSTTFVPKPTPKVDPVMVAFFQRGT